MTDSNIRPKTAKSGPIFVSLIVSILFLLILMSSNNSYAGEVKISFAPSPDSNAMGSKIYYGKTTSFSNFIDIGKSTTVRISNLQEGALYYFALKAYDQFGNDSEFSEIFSLKIPQKDQDSDKPTNSTTGNNSNSFSGFSENFQRYSTGDTPSDWFGTQSGNIRSEDDTLFKVINVNGNYAFGTDSTLADIHSHYLKSYIEEFSSFEFSGKMMTTHPDGEIGVTFLSQHPFNHVYYRLKCTDGHSSFHLSPQPMETDQVSGTTDTGVIPRANQWYRFRIRVKDTGVQTEIMAKVWPKNTPEPDQWQIDAYDDSSDRLVAGTFGVWSSGPGDKYWDNFQLVR